jgi:hypothetical protein
MTIKWAPPSKAEMERRKPSTKAPATKKKPETKKG